jgi:hypothetical protein
MNAYVILSLTLCLSDLLMLLFTGIPITISMLKLREPVPHPFCTISGWFLNFNLRMCSFLTTCICSIRCFSVLSPFRTKALLGRKYLLLMVLFSTILAFLSASLPFFFSDLKEGNPRYHGKYYQYNRLVGFCYFTLPVFYPASPTNFYLTLLLIEGVFFVPFIISIITCCAMVPVLRKKAHHGPINSAEESNVKAIWSICRITLFTVACFAPQLMWAIVDKMCHVRYSFCTSNDNDSDFCR